MATVGVPTVSRMGQAFGDYGAGFAGGAVYQLATRLLGGTLGSIVAPILAGSVIKGERGRIISTVAGFNGGRGIISNTGNSNAGSRGVM